MGKRAGAKAKAPPSRPGSGKGLPKRGGKSKGTYSAEDYQDLVCQLQPMGLRVVKMEPDGNCLFRAVADQLCGDAEEHNHYREKCCNHMIESADEFSLFYADDDFEASCGSFEAYVERMRSPGNWGSQLELMALCQAFGVNVIVHQVGSPSYEMEFSPAHSRCLQLSYHDGEHYNSVRFEWDMRQGQAVSFLSLHQLKMKESDVTGLVEEVRYSLPPNHGLEESALRLILLQSKYDAGVAVERLLNRLAGLPEAASEPAEHREPETAAGVGGSAPEAAPEAEEVPAVDGPGVSEPKADKRARARAEKRNERKAKAEAKRKPQASTSSETAEDGIPRAAMEQLSKQLLAV